MQSKNQKKNKEFEEKKSDEMKKCTFQPKITQELAKNLKNSLNKSSSSKKSFDKSSNLISNNDSYVELYKKKRGQSLSGRIPQKKTMK